MSRSVVLEIFGEPKSQPRHRSRAVVPGAADLQQLYMNAGDCVSPLFGTKWVDELWKEFRRRLVKAIRVQTYYGKEAEPANDWKQLVLEAWIRIGEAKFTGPIEIHITVILPRPKSKTRKTKPNLREWDTRSGRVGGDWDNFGKAICDALNGLAYDDDRQIVSGSVGKLMAGGDDAPGAIVRIYEVIEQPQAPE